MTNDASFIVRLPEEDLKKFNEVVKSNADNRAELLRSWITNYIVTSENRKEIENKSFEENNPMTVLNELYIFSNIATPPAAEFKEGINSDYIDLSIYLDPEQSAAPSYSGTFEHNVNEIDRFKRDLINDYDFVHVYKRYKSEYDPGTMENEVFYYKYSHKEFNIKGERKRA